MIQNRNGNPSMIFTLLKLINVHACTSTLLVF